MSQKKYLLTPSGIKVYLDSQGMPILKGKSINKHRQEYNEALFQADSILRNSPYFNYKPLIFKKDSNMQGFRGYNNANLYVLNWKKLYLEHPKKKMIAPWTNSEKAYFESLNTTTQRYQYLCIRSGLRSSVVDIPLEAIGNGSKYPQLVDEVEDGSGYNPIEIVSAEYNLSIALLGYEEGFRDAGYDNTPFLARRIQSKTLSVQVGFIPHSDEPLWHVKPNRFNNPLKNAMVTQLEQSIKPDRFDMYPYIDELVPPSWNWDFARTCDTYKQGIYDSVAFSLVDMKNEGKLIDPTLNPSQSEKSRKEYYKFLKENYNKYLIRYDYGIEDDNDDPSRDLEFFIIRMIAEAKIIAVTPPQGYPNAPYYFFPEDLEERFENGTLDFNLDPRIPAIQRVGFPPQLRQKILNYAKKHKIKDDKINYG
ncbi:hypothetical protein DCO58_07470 [Helicobacter saguini]|uniref:Uncharacterized protein n=1 Tax=Helicobacter saguini TaxID=1548018 RepID=A0A347VNB8_9HELI|nr:hypothetical protein [Helicobacter saguini]MWV61827.1 hypothetical protein [Helicobacter saguini]MWV67498.1 hypothetical protein [Helicobacter saguini]MWV69849.1 hypothetical protein [Helicobacter saguini]MWV72933.1 hypothetical protein [Helicobacter saguini]TLD95683.1 hypothetical protein LS64_002190 [Helicobacter saguini]